MMQGVIVKALSGFYYVDTGEEIICCRARGRFRKEKIVPLVGDYVTVREAGPGQGVLHEILPRKNVFIRPPVANIDLMVMLASAVIPVTEPYLIDRVAVIALHNGVKPVLCINKTDLDPGEELFSIYARSGIPVIRTSAVTGEGIEELREAIAGKICAFTGNSGVGKSSVLNALYPEFSTAVGEVSEKLGRGRHTTRHVEMFRLPNGAVIADTPGFSSFDTDRMELMEEQELQHCFPEFKSYLGQCRFLDCAHLKEDGCAVLGAVGSGAIHESRYMSYARLYQQVSQLKAWEIKPQQNKI